MSRLALPAAVAALTALAAAPSLAAAAPTVTLDRSCYAHLPTKGSQPIVANIAGGTPGANFVLSATVPGKGTGSAGSVSGTFDAAGNAVAQIADVFPPSGTIDPSKGEPVALSIADFGAGGVDTPVGSTLITTIAIDVSSKPRSPRKRRRLSVSAGSVFAGQTLFGFIVRPKSSHVLRRFRVGKANVCGYASTRAIVAPPGFRPGAYRVYVNPGRKLRKKFALAMAFRITRRF